MSIEVLISLLITLLFLVAIFYIAKLVVRIFGLPGEVLQIVGAILGLIFLAIALNAFGLAPLRWR